MRQPHRNREPLPRLNIDIGPAGDVEADGALLEVSVLVGRCSSRGENMYLDVEAFVVHFVEMENWPVALRRERTFDDGESVLRV